MNNNTIELYQNDCIKQMDDFIHEGRMFDVTFTSPPYNRKRNDKYSEYDDTIPDYFSFVCDATDRMIKLSRRYVFLNLQTNYYNREDVYRLIGKYAKLIVNIVVWEKSNPLPANGFNITNAFEYFIVLGNTPLKSNTTYTKNHITTSVNSETTTKIHKAVMKTEVCEWFIDKFTKENDIVFDPFLGLGTTGIVCAKNNRNFVGVELNKQYFDIAKERIEHEAIVL